TNKQAIKHAIYWHHAKPYRKEKDAFSTYKLIAKKLIANQKEKSLINLLASAHNLLNHVSNIDKRYNDIPTSRLAEIYNQEFDLEGADDLSDAPVLPNYKDYEPEEAVKAYAISVTLNARNNLHRACVITADRVVSALNAIE